MTKPTPLRALVAVDVNNLWCSCQQFYGANYRVDYSAIQRLVLELAGRPLNAKWVAYAVSAPRSQKFVTNLEQLGFLVKLQEIRREKDGRSRGWDVGLAVDAMALINDYDALYLASGDGNLAPLLKELKKKSKHIEVITFKQATSHLLYKLADHITFLGKNEIFEDRR